MNLTAEQQSPQLIEPVSRRPRKILAVVVILVVLVGLFVSIASNPTAGGQSSGTGPDPLAGGNITGGLVWIGQIIISFIAVLSSIVELTGFSVRDFFSSRAAKTNVEAFPFYVFQDYDKLLEYLFPDPKTPLLSDRTIAYLPQIAGQADTAFQGDGFVLIRGRSKTGKTREACELLKRWWYTGPTVLVVRSHVGLYPPYKIPANLPTRNLVIVFDDIDRYLGEPAALNRLDETIQFFKEICHEQGELRIVATVRQEDEFWEKLKFDPRQSPWNKFQLVQLDPLSTEKALEVIQQLSWMSGIAIAPELAQTLAEKNNGTFLNLALTFRGWLSQGIKVVTDQEVRAFEGTLKNTWRRRYESLARSNPAVKPVYAAIDFMQTHNLPLRPGLITELAAEMSMPKWLLLSLGLGERLRNWIDLSPLFNWHRNKNQRRIGWFGVFLLALFLLYLVIYALLRFVPGDVQYAFFIGLENDIAAQLRCLTPMWLTLFPFAFSLIFRTLRNLTSRKVGQSLDFLLGTEIPLRENGLRPYENQVEGNGSTRNWDIQDYIGEAKQKGLPRAFSIRLMNVYLSLAEHLRIAGEFSPARSLATVAQNLAPEHPACFFMLGKIEMEEGNLEQSLSYFEQSAQRYSNTNNRAYPLENQSLIYLSLLQYETAENTARKALKMMPNLRMAHWVLGLSQIKQDKTQAGQENCRKAQSLNPQIPAEIAKVIPAIGGSEILHIMKTDKPTSIAVRFASWKKNAYLLLPVFFVAVSLLFFSIMSEFRTFVWGERGLKIANSMLQVFPNAPMLIYIRGNSYAQISQYKEALDDYNKCIQMAPGFASGYRMRGWVYDAIGEYEKAISDFTQAIEIDPIFSPAYADRGRTYYNIGEYKKAISDYDEAIRIDYTYIWAYSWRAMTYLELGNAEKAFESYTEAIQNNPASADAYFNRAYAYGKINEYEKAIADYTEVIHLDPEYVDAYAYRGHGYKNLEQYEKAIADYAEAIRLEPQDVYAYNNLGDAYLELGNTEKAFESYTEAIQNNPASAGAYLNRAHAYGKINEYEKAIADYTEAIRLDPQYAFAYSNRGNAWNELGRYEEAIADHAEAIHLEPILAVWCRNISCYTAVINLNPNDASAYLKRGDAYYRLSDYEKAITDYTEAIRISPKYALAYINRGNVYYRLSDDEKAIMDYIEAVRLDNDLPDALGILLEAEAERGHIVQVLDWLSQLERNQSPIKNANTYNNICWFGSLWGQAHQVLNICEQAVELAPDNADIRDSRGLARALTGDIDGAILDFQYFIDNSNDTNAVAKRKLWIPELQKGNNPFTSEVLESLK